MDNDEKLQPLLDKDVRTKIKDACETVTNWVTNKEGVDAAAYKKKKEACTIIVKFLFYVHLHFL